jgi:hypothetical protein
VSSAMIKKGRALRVDERQSRESAPRTPHPCNEILASKFIKSLSNSHG